MKALVLAAGYGTRLGRDIENDQSGRYAHLAGVSKPLLPIGERQSGTPSHRTPDDSLPPSSSLPLRLPRRGAAHHTLAQSAGQVSRGGRRLCRG